MDWQPTRLASPVTMMAMTSILMEWEFDKGRLADTHGWKKHAVYAMHLRARACV